MKQPPDSIIQVTFLVRDISSYIEHYAKALKVAPFFMLEHVPQVNPDYRGQAVSPDFSVAMAFSGGLQIELIQQHCNTPSIYKELLDAYGEGFHHIARSVMDFDAALADYQDAGWSAAWRVDVPGIGRVAYLDTYRQLHTYIELMELTPGLINVWDEMERISETWDGRDLVRPMPGL